MLKCDVLIVGNGVAGSVTALKALKHGLKIIIIEKEKKIGTNIDTKLDLTESIGIENIIKELDLPIHDKSNVSKWFSPNHVLDFNSSIYDLYVKRGIDEDSFENKNISKILDGGGQLLTETNIKLFKWGKNNRVDKVIVKKDKKNIEIEPSFIIGADGVNSAVLKLSRLSSYENIIGKFIGIGVYGKNFNLPTGITHVFFDRNIAPGGYIFAAKSKENNCVLAVGIDSSMTNINPQQYYKKIKSHKLLSDILKDAEIKNPLSGFGRIGLLKRHSIGNIMLVGDAGRFPDPLFCYGVRQAILSGYNAAKTINLCLQSAIEKKPSEKFESSMVELQNEIKLGYFLRKAFRKMRNKDIDTIVKILSDAQKDGLDIDYLFKKNNNLLIKNIIRNFGRCSSITLRALPNIIEYLVNIRHI